MPDGREMQAEPLYHRRGVATLLDLAWSLLPAPYREIGKAAAVVSLLSVTINASTRRPSGNCAPESSSTRVSRIFLSTRSVGSSVRTFLGPSCSPTWTTRPQNFRLPYASAVT